VLPHLDAAYNLARWLTHDHHDAEDVVQEALMRAFKYFSGFRGGDSRAWVLTIVRNTSYTWLQQNKKKESETQFDEEVHGSADDATNPETIVLKSLDEELLRSALEELPVEFREALVLRELEGFSYKEIAQISDIPIGTVMSRLARARKQLEQRLVSQPEKEN
jgi:RNA polymerase sigma-70 factor, ECF subfamily